VTFSMSASLVICCYFTASSYTTFCV